MSATITDGERLDELTSWPAWMDGDTMDEIDFKWDDISSRRSRRLLLTMLTMDSEKLFEICEKDPETFFEGFRCSAATLGRYKQIVELLDIGHHRLLLGLFGFDMDDPDAPFTKEQIDEAISEAKGRPFEKAGGAS